MSKETGGRAFPASHDEYTGMTLRDYFAAKVLQGLMVNAGDDYCAEGIAIMAYQMADAMIKERSK